MKKFSLEEIRAWSPTVMTEVAATIAQGSHVWDQCFTIHSEGGGHFSGRNNALVVFLGLLRAKRFSIDVAIGFAEIWNATYCSPPLPVEVVRDSIGRFWSSWAQGTLSDDLPGGKTLSAWEVLDWSRMIEEETKAGQQSWLIPNVLAKGGLHYLSAPPGHGKTWLMCDLIRAACQGDRWLHEYDIPQTGVLYIDEEMGVAKVMHRLRLLGMRSADGLGYLNRAGIKLDSRTDVDRLVSHCETSGVGLVVIDSLVRVHNYDENNASEMRKLFIEFGRFLDAGITLLIAHHNRKGGTESMVKHEGMRGSAEIAAAADMAYSCEKQSNGLYSLSCTKGRLIADEDSLSATVEIRDVDGITMVRTLDASSRSQVITADIRSKVTRIIGESPGISLADLTKVMGVRPPTLRDTLTSLEAGRVVTVTIGLKNAKSYSLSGLL